MTDSRYVTRQIVVDAWQHLKERKDHTVQMPAWVLSALLDGKLAVDGGNIRVTTASGKTEIALDQHWIVLENGHFRAYTPDVFQFKYEPLPTAKEE